MATKATLKAEANNDNVTFEYDGDSYTVPTSKNWPLEAVEAQESNKILGFLKELLGEDQYATLRKGAKTLDDIDSFAKEMFKALELEPGK